MRRGSAAGHVAVWTGTQMIVWGGTTSQGVTADGAAYDPRTDTWTALDEANAPSARYGHVAVWDGTELIVWGGKDDKTAFPSGGRFKP